MRALLTAVLGVGLIVCATAAGQDEKKDKEKLQGAWSCVSYQVGGEAIPQNLVNSVKITFDGDKVTMESRDRKAQGTFRLDASKKPKEFTIELKAPKALLGGIYEINGDNLKICSHVGTERVKEFVSKKG